MSMMDFRTIRCMLRMAPAATAGNAVLSLFGLPFSFCGVCNGIRLHRRTYSMFVTFKGSDEKKTIGRMCRNCGNEFRKMADMVNERLGSE